MVAIPDLEQSELVSVVLVAIVVAVMTWSFSGLDSPARLASAVLGGIVAAVAMVVTLSVIQRRETDSTDGDAS